MRTFNNPNQNTAVFSGIPVVFLALLIALFTLAPWQVAAQAGEVNGPGWIEATADPVSSEEAAAFFAALPDQTEIQTGRPFSAASGAAPYTEITALARALQHDPKLIYDYVHNYIDYVPYYGSTKGATTLTLLDGSGNDFDQASLMIALLRASGFTDSKYILGKMTIPGNDMANWLGVDAIWQVISRVVGSGGIPGTIYTDTNGTTKMDRVWVKATINGSDYLFDPAFKSYTDIPKTTIANAMGYSQVDFLAAANAGATRGDIFRPEYQRN